jgi:nucleotide-binding universal stress UspA family protein
MSTPAFPIVLVPLDGSGFAEQALPVAAAIARRTDATLHLASVQMPMPVLAPGAEDFAVDVNVHRELREQLQAYLASTAQTVSTPHGLEVTSALLDGLPADALAQYARAKHVALIVMTTHGHGGLSRLWLGSVADRLLRRVTVPVLLLRPREEPPQTEFRRILVALDGSSESEAVVEPAVALGAPARDAHYTLIQVVEPPVALITRMAMHPAHLRPHWREHQENRARSFLERVANRLRARGLAVTTQVLSARGAGEQIVKCADAAGADLIAVGTHGSRGWERMLLGSVADKVVRGATQPVLVVPVRIE